MSEIRELYKKKGKEALIQYRRSGLLPIVGIEVLLLGKSRKSLEIIRLIAQNKIQRKLEKKYRNILDQSLQRDYVQLPRKHEKKIWFCWLQGIEHAPKLVQECYQSLKKYISEYEIILITEQNMFQYVQFPTYIMEKWRKGIITNTHLSDLLRVELLIRYGGTWIDSTVLCTGMQIPKYILDSDLFLYQVLKPGRDGHAITISSWLMTACSNNRVLLITRDLLYEYWKTHNMMMDYFLLHMFLSIVLEQCHEEQKRIVKVCNSLPHILLLDLFEPYDDERYEEIKKISCFHKLNYKRETNLLEKKGTYYDYIINHQNY